MSQEGEELPNSPMKLTATVGASIEAEDLEVDHEEDTEVKGTGA